MLHISEIFRDKGSDAWYAMEEKDLLPAGVKCQKCGCTDLKKKHDIMDVWFDSGSTHAAVLQQRPELNGRRTFIWRGRTSTAVGSNPLC